MRQRHYGHTGIDVVAKRQYSLDECRALLSADMQRAVAQVEACQPGLPVPVLAAFADAAYNLGPIVACSRVGSTAARMLHAGDLTGACNQLPRWDMARVLGVMVSLPGLAARRAAERELCLTGSA